MNNKYPLVSVIIPTHNSEKTINLCLRSIKKQSYKNIEIIVIDRYSKDNTIQIVNKYKAKLYQIDCERTVAKNFGLKNARGKYVLFIDSDMVLMEKVIEECVKLAESNQKIGDIVIPERSIGNTYWARVRDFERSFYVETLIESPRFFRRDLALKAGGFDEDIVFYEEATLSIKIEELGYKIRARINSYIMHYEENFSLTKWLRKKYYYGKTARVYKTRYVEYGSKQMSLPYRFGLFLKNKRFWSKPHLAFSVLLLKLLEYLAAGLGYIRSI